MTQDSPAPIILDDIDKVNLSKCTDLKDQWILDSGAARTFCNDKMCMRNVITSAIKHVQTADGKAHIIQGVGEAIIRVTDNGNAMNIVIPDAYYVPSFNQSLLSVSHLIDRGNQIQFTQPGATITSTTGQIMLTATVQNGLYVVNRVLDASAAKPATPDVWHKRLAHLNSDYLRKMPELCNGIHMKGSITSEICPSCIAGKQHRNAIATTSWRCTKKPLDLIHSDIWGPSPTRTPSHKSYYVSFTDDFSRYSVVNPISKKSDFLAALTTFIASAETQQKTRVKAIRFDNAGENLSTAVKTFLDQKGIIIDSIPPYTPQLNGVAERLNRTLMEKVRCLLDQSGLPKTFWAEALQTAVFVKNISPTKALPNGSPYIQWFGKKPDLSNLGTFGCRAFVFIRPEKRTKLSPKSEPGVLLGYSSSKEVRVLTSSGVIRTRDVILDETCFPRKTMESHETELEPQTPMTTKATTQATLGTTEEPMYSPDTLAFHTTITDEEEPSTFAEAMALPDASQWKAAIDDEYNSLVTNNTWILVDKPEGCNLVGTRWIFKKKLDANGNTTRYKARLVAQGFSQSKGIDYNETFTSVAKFTTVRMCFATAAITHLYQRQLDVKTAFLHGDIHENIYAKQLEGFIDRNNPDKVLKFVKALYGLKQAPRAWYDKLTSILKLDGFQRSTADYSLFLKGSGATFASVLFYVDDMIVSAASLDSIRAIVKFLKSKFEISDLGEPAYFLGIEIIRDKSTGTIKLHQTGYIKKLLQRFQMESSNPSDTPMDVNCYNQILQKGKGKDVPESDVFPYAQAVGALIYLAVVTRPDIAFAVGIVSRFMSSPLPCHVTAVKRIFKYLNATSAHGLTYSKDMGYKVVGFCDADYANCPVDRRSVGAYTFLCAGSAVSWSSKKQTCIATSTTDAEYMALSQAAREASWLSRLAAELQIDIGIITISCDNSGAVALSSNPAIHQRTKHIDVIHHYVRQQIEHGRLLVNRISTKQQLADILTKPLPKISFQDLVQRLLGLQVIKRWEC